MNTADMNIYDRFFCLFKGEPGVGKSAAAHSWVHCPQTDERKGSYTFDFDFKMKAVKNYFENILHDPINFEYDTFNDLSRVFIRLEEFDKYCPFKNLFWDSNSSFADLTLDQQIRFRAPNKAKITVVDGVVELNQIEDYGGEARAITRAHNTLKKISVEQKVNVIVTAHVFLSKTTDYKGVTKVSRVILTGGNKIAVKIPKDFDEMYHFDVDVDYETQAPKYIVRTCHTGDDSARTSLPLPQKIDWTNKSLFKIIQKELEVTRL